MISHSQFHGSDQTGSTVSAVAVGDRMVVVRERVEDLDLDRIFALVQETGDICLPRSRDERADRFSIDPDLCGRANRTEVQDRAFR